MFSRKKKSSKNDLVGVFRSMFTSHSSKNNLQSLQGTSLKNDSLKPLFRRKIKLPSFKVPGSKQWRKETSALQMSPERRGLYNAIISPDFGFEKVDLSVSISSILKNPNSEHLSHKKRLRFIDESNSNNISSSTNDDTMKNSESLVNDTIATELDSVESDIEYYTKMKVKIFERNADIQYKKAKRSDSFKSKSNETLLSQQEEEKKIDEHKLIPLDTFQVCRLDSPNLSQINFADMKTITMLPKPLCLRKWVSDNDVKPKDENIQPVKPFIFTAQKSESISSDLATLFSENRLYCTETQHNLCSKVLTLKKYKSNRFDPMSKNESCGVSMLKTQRSNSSRMSWGQAENLI